MEISMHAPEHGHTHDGGHSHPHEHRHTHENRHVHTHDHRHGDVVHSHPRIATRTATNMLTSMSTATIATTSTRASIWPRQTMRTHMTKPRLARTTTNIE
jgi:ABC-type Zn2+ transport system substrate-binding protein/surface adhesin